MIYFGHELDLSAYPCQVLLILNTIFVYYFNCNLNSVLLLLFFFVGKEYEIVVVL